MRLRFIFLLSALLALLLCPASGVDFETCKGSSCSEWLSFIDDSAKEVKVHEVQKGEATSQYYLIEVKSGGTFFTNYRRYSEFANLKDKLGDVAANLSPFPQKWFWNEFVELLYPDDYADRRMQLEAWLQKVLAHGDSKGPWARDLFLFLDPVTSVTIANCGVSMPPDANVKCKESPHYYTESVHFFGIDVDTNPARVWRRYTDFREFHDKLEKLGGMKDLRVPFPPKLLLGNFWEKSIENRRRELEAWLAHVKTHSNSASGGIWEKELKTFLDADKSNNAVVLMKCSWDHE